MGPAIGIDTGGTYTDAVLYDFEKNRILGQGKALTTHEDLTAGILNALDMLDPTLCRQAELAGISTTLATNACVEGKFRRTRLLLMGIDRTGIARHGKDYGFTDPDNIRYLPCKTSITGEIFQEPDWGLLREKAREWFQDAEGCAVCEIYGVRNGGVLEKRAAKILEEETGLPAVCASSLSSGLSSLERAAGAVLNGGLLPIVREFLQGVETAFQRRGIHTKIFVVRSDSSLMGLDYSAEHAVETLMSGPAASALGGCTLTGERDAVVVDMGGTTTDIALVEAGRPLPEKEGIRIGKWKTQVRGLFSASFALGGDSVIRWDRRGCLTLGPGRVKPLCVLAEQHPEIVLVLQKQVLETPVHTLPLCEFLTLNRKDWRRFPMSAGEQALCAALERGPLIYQAAAEVMGTDLYSVNTQYLEERGIVLRAGLTPTDIMHIRGDYTRFPKEASRLAAEFTANSLRIDAEALGAMVCESVSREIFYGVSRILLSHADPYYKRHGTDGGIEELLRLQWENRAAGGTSLLQYSFQMPAKLIGIGGPIHLFLPEAANALGTECLIPDCAAVANAVGAVMGRTTASASASIRPHGRTPSNKRAYDFEVWCEGEPPRCFEEEEEAAAWAEKILRSKTEARVRAQGASGTVSFQVEKKEEAAPLGAGFIKLGLQMTVTASTCFREETKPLCSE